MITHIRKLREKRLAKASVVAPATVRVYSCSFCALSRFRVMGVRQEQAREPLGSLSSVGEVYVDDSAAAAESTIFVDDKVHTGGNRLCGIYHDWKGRTEDFAQSQVTFTRDYQFTAELTHGEGSNRSARPRLKDKVSAARFGQKKLLISLTSQRLEVPRRETGYRKSSDSESR